MKVSIIVSTYNRCEKLRILLDALRNLYLSDAVECEVLVVDNNSSDLTAEFTTDYLNCQRPVFKYVFEQRQGKSHALNAGIRKAEGGILVFTDDDCIPDPRWVECVAKEFEEDPSLSVLGGRVELSDKDASPHSISHSNKRAHIFRPRDVLVQPMIMGNNMAIRRNALDVLPELDPLLGPGSICRAAEDIDFLYRLHKRGSKMVYSPDALVFHNHGRKTQAEDDAVACDYGMGRGGLYFKHIARLDFSILRVALGELYSLSRTLLKGFIVRKPFRYHQLTFSALFAGASCYCKGSLAQRRG